MSKSANASRDPFKNMGGNFFPTSANNVKKSSDSRSLKCCVLATGAALLVFSGSSYYSSLVSAAAAFVQQNFVCPQSPQSSVALKYTSAQTAGNTNVVVVGWNDTTSSITSVADSSGNTYQVAVPMFRGNGLSQAIYY